MLHQCHSVTTEDIGERTTISFPHRRDREILAAIMNLYGLNQSSAIRLTLREFARANALVLEGEEGQVVSREA